MTKFCSDCQFCRPAKQHDGIDQFKFATCARPVDGPVDGYALLLPFCRVARMTKDNCGQEGQFFAPKEAPMQCPNCLGYRHDGACPPDDTEAPRTGFHMSCPWCGSDPGLARSSIVGDRIWYLVGCESDECACNPQVSGFTLAGAWAAWDTRAPVSRATELELAGAGGLK